MKKKKILNLVLSTNRTITAQIKPVTSSRTLLNNIPTIFESTLKQ